MKNLQIHLPILVTLALAGGLGMTATAAPPDIDDLPLTLTGCLVAGEGKDSYLLTNVTIEGPSIAPFHAFTDSTPAGLQGSARAAS